MRFHALLLVAVLLGGSRDLPAQAVPNGWQALLAGEALRFSVAASNTVGDPAVRAALRPTDRWGVSVGVARRMGAWEPAFELGWADGDVEAVNSLVSLTDKTLDMSRVRIAPMLARRVAGLDRGELLLALGPTLELWSVGGAPLRLRVAPAARVALRLGVGRVSLENAVAFSISGSPYTQDELPESVVRRSLRTLAVSTGVRVPL